LDAKGKELLKCWLPARCGEQKNTKNETRYIDKASRGEEEGEILGKRAGKKEADENLKSSVSQIL